MGPRSARFPLLARVAAVLMGTLLGCATIEHSMSISEVAGRTLSTRGGDGAARLQAEMEVDATLRDFVAGNGRPDYLHVVDRMGLYFFYVREDRAVKFERELIPPSTVRDLGRIPGSLFKLLPKRDVDSLVARREVEQRQHEARAAAKPRRRRAAPAARDPSGFLSRFDVREITGRMREPLTAADPGVSGWRNVRFSDGVSGSTAKRGGTRYEVRPDRLVVAMSISSARKTPPPQARLEVMRVNSAVFGAHAKAVTEHTMKLMTGVASDRTGRSPAAQRIRGRMVRIDRVPQTGQIVYVVRP
jgi:hypothetical protein